MKIWAREHYYIMQEAQSTITQTRYFKNWCVMLSIQGLSGQYIQNNFPSHFTTPNTDSVLPNGLLQMCSCIL